RKAREYYRVRMPFLHDLTLQTTLQEIATGLGGLSVITVGAMLAGAGRLDAAILPLLTLLAMSAFVPVWGIAQVGRQPAVTLGAARRVHAVHSEPVPVTNGPGVPSAASASRTPALQMDAVVFSYPGRDHPALAEVSLIVPRGSTVALVGPSGA